MNLIGLLSWYDEPASWLTAAIASHHRLGLTHLIAVDGAYELYPGGQARSGTEQHRAIADTCEALGISSTIHAPVTTWHGNEVEKRNHLFNLAYTTTTSTDDWFIVIDADHLATDPENLHPILEATDRNVGEVMLWQRPDPTTPEAQQFRMPRVHQSTIRLLYRANPGIHCAGNHYTYQDADNRLLWAQDTPGTALEPALDLTHIRVEHRTNHRDIARHQDQYTYYRRRDQLNIERRDQTCDWLDCPDPPEHTVPHNFETLAGTEALQAGSINVCAKHLKRVHYENRTRLAKMGMDYGQQGELLKRH